MTRTSKKLNRVEENKRRDDRLKTMAGTRKWVYRLESCGCRICGYDRTIANDTRSWCPWCGCNNRNG